MNIKELAERTGFSTATISRVLQGELNVEQSTRDKIMEHLAQLSFYADTKPKKKKLRNLYVVISPSGMTGRLYDSHINFFSKMFSGIRDTLARLGKEVSGEPYVLNINYEHGQLADKLKELEALPYAGNIAAMFLVNGREVDEKQILNRQLVSPMFILNRFYEKTNNPNISFIYFDNKEIGNIAYQELYDKGHRNIAVLAGPPAYRYYTERLSAFIDNKDEASIKIFTVDNNDVSAAAKTANDMIPFIKNGETSAVYVCSELLLEGCLKAFETAGIIAGKDVSLISSNDYFLAYQHSPQISVIRTPSYELGEIAATLAVKGVELDFSLRTNSCVGVKLIERKSVLQRTI